MQAKPTQRRAVSKLAKASRTPKMKNKSKKHTDKISK
jgi:hypothetical protein